MNGTGQECQAPLRHTATAGLPLPPLRWFHPRNAPAGLRNGCSDQEIAGCQALSLSAWHPCVAITTPHTAWVWKTYAVCSGANHEAPVTGTIASPMVTC